MKHRIVYKFYLTQKEAEKDLKKLENDCPTAFVELTEAGHYGLYLYASNFKHQTEMFLKEYRKKNIICFYDYRWDEK